MFDPALPGQRIPVDISGSRLFMVDEREQRVNPYPSLNVGAACSFSEYAVISVASRSITNGAARDAPAFGACSPANAQARSRAACLAVSIAASNHGRIRRDRAVDIRLSADGGDIAGRVPRVRA